MAVYTTEIASDHLGSDNPIHQRLVKAYHLALPYIKGEVLEIGCGEGRGIELLLKQCQRYVAIDKIGPVIDRLSRKFPSVEFHQMSIPPIPDFADHSFDCIISFQVIEHIKDDLSFLQEIKRILKKGGQALITTPNNKYTLTRNPWHQREYLSHELFQLASSVFDEVEMYGIKGNEKVMDYYYQNKKSVRKITRFDILDLQHKLPASWLRVPYDLLNRMNRRGLQREDDQLVASISHQDYLLTESAQDGLDLFCVLTKS